MADQTSTTEQKDQLVDHLIDVATSPKYEGGEPQNDPDDEELMAFLEVAFREIVGQLAENHKEAQHLGASDFAEGHFDEMMDLFDPDNVEEIQVRDNGRFQSPKVTIWLTGDVPMWANYSWRSELTYSVNRPHYNGNPAHAVLDVRPY